MRASTPGQGCSETAAPPTWSRRSSTSTERPARASSAAATSPLWPPPMTMTSYTRAQRLEQLHERLPRRLGDRLIGHLAADHVDALGEPRVLARGLGDPHVGNVQ